MINRKFREDIRVRDHTRLQMARPGDGGGSIVRAGGGAPPIQPIQVESNVHLKLIDPKTDKVVEERESHNIFLNYGRDWLANLISLSALSPDTTFRDDRLRYMAFGIGGTSQLIAHGTIASSYPGYASDWGGAAAAAAPTQTDVDPTVTALEWPVLINATEWYDDISAPVTFPSTGIARFTAVLGTSEVSFGAFSSVPLSEVGLFTQGITTQPGGLTTEPIVYGGLPATKYMVAYNTFDTLSKTSSFILQTDWELRFS